MHSISVMQNHVKMLGSIDHKVLAKRKSMKKVIFFALLSAIRIDFLSADEYFSDISLEEISAQTDVVYESINKSTNDLSMDSLPILRRIEDEEQDQELLFDIYDSNQTSVEDDNMTLSPYLDALKKAKNEDKIVMIAIRATHCKYCDLMEKETLTDSSVQEALEKNFISIYYNQDLETLPIGLQKGITPNFIFVNSNEDILNIYPGMRNPEEFKEVLEQILSM